MSKTIPMNLEEAAELYVSYGGVGARNTEKLLGTKPSIGQLTDATRQILWGLTPRLGNDKAAQQAQEARQLIETHFGIALTWEQSPDVR